MGTRSGSDLPRFEGGPRMRGHKLASLLAVVALFTLPAMAGDGADCKDKENASVAHAGHKAEYKKCTAGTQECLDAMAAKLRSGGFVGVELEPDEATGAYAVIRVVPGSPAEAAGIEAGDVLYALDGIKLSEENEAALKAAKKDWKAGQVVTYTVKRHGDDRKVTLTLAPMPEEVIAKWVGKHMLEHASTEVATK